jgi:hypothetical protein
VTSEPADRRADIAAFLKGLNQREKLVVLAYLSNDTMISARIPNLAAAVLEMHRSCHRLELLKLARGSDSRLGHVLKRKARRPQRLADHMDRWRILRVDDNVIWLGMEGRGDAKGASDLA